MKFVTAYTPAEKRGDFATYSDEESMAQESDMEDSDINIIMKKYNTTGLLPQINMEALTGDFSEAGDFRDAQEKLRAANEAFAEVPAALRRRFDNDPQKFIDFVMDDANLEETVKLGYRQAPPKKVEPPKEPANGNEPPKPKAD